MAIFTGPRPYMLRNIRPGHADVHVSGLGDTRLLGFVLLDGLPGENPWVAIPSTLDDTHGGPRSYATRHEAAMDLVERFR